VVIVAGDNTRNGLKYRCCHFKRRSIIATDFADVGVITNIIPVLQLNRVVIVAGDNTRNGLKCYISI